MPNTQNNPHLIDEADIPKNWEPIEAEPTIPGAAAAAMAATPSMPPYYRGSIDSNLEHDAQFVATDRTPRVTSIPLMPIAPSGNPQNNAAIQSIIKINQTAAAISALSDMIFRGVWNPLTSYAIGNVVLFNESAYVAITGSVGLQPDLNSTNWTLLSENLVFNPTISQTTGGFGLGSFQSAVLNSGSSATLSTGNVTPSAPGQVALWFGAYGTGSSPESALDLPNLSASGWSLAGVSASGQQAALVQFRSNTSTFSGNAGIGSSQPWASVTTLWSFGGNFTAPITSVSVNGSDVATVVCNNTFKAGEHVSFSGLTSATFLNGQTVQITSATTSQIVFSFTHAAYGPTADTGTATLNPYVQLGFSQSGSFSPPYALTFGSPVTAGNIIIVIVFSNAGSGGAAGLTGVTDSLGNTYTVLKASTGTGGFNGIQVSIAYAENIAAGTPTVTINGNGGSGATILGTNLQAADRLLFIIICRMMFCNSGVLYGSASPRQLRTLILIRRTGDCYRREPEQLMQRPPHIWPQLRTRGD